MGAPAGTYATAIGMAAAEHQVYVLRDDGAVFVLFKWGDLQFNGEPARHPYWAPIPAVPGTIAALEQQGKHAAGLGG